MNGHKVTLAKIEDKEFVLRSDAGEEIRVPRDTPLHLDYAWISTAYSSQGMTCDRVLLSTDRTMLREGLYVAASRAKYELRVYTPEREGLDRQAEKSQAKTSALEVATKENAPRVLETPNVSPESVTPSSEHAPTMTPPKSPTPEPQQETARRVVKEETVEMEMDL